MRNPELQSLCGCDICGLKVAQNRSDAEVLLVNGLNEIIAIRLYNEDKSPILFEVGELDLRLITEEDRSWVTLGEFEYYHEDSDGWIHFEGDSGLFSFLCSHVQITKYRANKSQHPTASS